ncbi:hypothetical protein LSCM1_00133 [Leishmania martiniquensis]|uniref:Uncharacterized protein n=1 Tax=Leishmania martiniquensis TaxID=1580590 RepID=A0A836K9K9_9TRYP|nr:hypothetical protein LSCM1_00133 [Leishmania martiniquensis]
MHHNASNTGRGSYATLPVSASALRRSKTDYGILLETGRRSKGKIARTAARRNSDAATEHALRHSASPRWGGVHETANRMQSATRSTKGATRMPLTPRGQLSSQSPHREKHVILAGSEEDMDDAASGLLLQLQQVVVRVSRQMVDERRRSAQQRQQIQALETIVAEQDAMLDTLREQCDAAQYERAHLPNRHQAELLLRSTGSVQTNQRSCHSHGTSEIRISAAHVDSCICAEFHRLSPTYDGPSYPYSWFDDVSPIVAAVLRSLATEVLQLRCAARKDEAEGGAVSHGKSPAPLHPRAACSPPSESAPKNSTPSLIPAATRLAPVADHDRAAVVGSVVPRPDVEKRTQASLPPAAAAIRPNSAPCETADRINGEKAGLLGSGLDTRMSHVTGAGARTASEASTSVAGSVYEDAASILSDIRARYGL